MIDNPTRQSADTPKCGAVQWATIPPQPYAKPMWNCGRPASDPIHDFNAAEVSGMTHAFVPPDHPAVETPTEPMRDDEPLTDDEIEFWRAHVCALDCVAWLTRTRHRERKRAIATIDALQQRIKELEGRHHLDQAQVKIVCARVKELEGERDDQQVSMLKTLLHEARAERAALRAEVEQLRGERGRRLPVQRKLCGMEPPPRGPEPIEHDLRTWPEYFSAVARGEKTFEWRFTGDRDFRVGDTLRLREYGHEGYTGREIVAGISYVMTLAQVPDYTILALAAAKMEKGS
jgi:hypothetical protein